MNTKESFSDLSSSLGLRPSLHPNRREFLRAAALAGAFAALSPTSRRWIPNSHIAPADADSALSYIATEMDRFHNNLAVFTDPGAPGNHFFALARIADVMDAVGIDICNREQIAPPGGLASIKSTFRNTTGTNFGGWYFLNGTLTGTQVVPSANFGTVPNAGVDLTGATQLTFWARGERGGEQIEFFMGGVGYDPSSQMPNAPFPDSTPRIPPPRTITTLTQQWQQYTIDVSKANLTYILGGFGWVAAAANNPSGANFWVDDIQYNKVRLDDPRFVRSYVPLGLTGFDLVFANSALTLDNALAILAFLARGNADDMRRASLIGDAFVYAQTHDPFYNDVRLRNAYQAGDLIVPPGWTPNGNSSTVNLPVIIDCSGGLPAQDEVQVSSNTGNLAWAVVSLLALNQKLGDSRYLDGAVKLAGWITGRRQNSGLGGYKSGSLGFDGSAVEQGNANSSDNLAIYAAFATMVLATRDQTWQSAADYAAKFVQNVYDSTVGCLLAGTVDDHNLNRDYLRVEDQALSVLALPQALSSLPDVVTCAQKHFQLDSDGFQGFDANDDRDGIWFAGTAMMVSAYQRLGNSGSAATYLQQLRNAQALGRNPSGGIIEASHDGVTTGFSSPSGKPIVLFKRLHLGTTALYALAERGVNPLYPATSVLPQISSVRKEGKNLIVVGNQFAVDAVILVNNDPQRTVNDSQNPTTILIGKKVGKRINAGDQVQVRNPDGSLSNIVIFQP
jgi:hypothetical protein